MSLSKVNASHKRVSKQTDEQLDAANRRVEAAQKRETAEMLDKLKGLGNSLLGATALTVPDTKPSD